MLGARADLVILRDPSSNDDVTIVRRLFEEYQAWLGIDLCFQGFREELATLPGAYAPPRGGLWLAMDGASAAGCVAFRPLGDDACEMKRLFVREPYRRTGLGRRLATTAVETAREAGYRRMLLDTLATMVEATTLYRALGFRETSAYRYNPHPDVLYFELAL